jgi:6,7-dimethyl-8-ribityllumazine synthase
MAIVEGQLEAKDLRFGLVVSKFNEFVTGRLLAGALDVLKKAGAGENALVVAKVPGAFEIPLIARRMARSGRFDAIICLGAVIRGETQHFEFISAEASRGIAQAAWESDVPVIFGVLTTENEAQAIERADPARGNKGREAALAALEMAELYVTQKQAPR